MVLDPSPTPLGECNSRCKYKSGYAYTSHIHTTHTQIYTYTHSYMYIYTFACTHTYMYRCPAFAAAPPLSEGNSSCKCNIGYSGKNGAVCALCNATTYKSISGPEVWVSFQNVPFHMCICVCVHGVRTCVRPLLINLFPDLECDESFKMCFFKCVFGNVSAVCALCNITTYQDISDLQVLIQICSYECVKIYKPMSVLLNVFILMCKHLEYTCCVRTVLGNYL